LFVLQNSPVRVPAMPGVTPKLLLDGHNGSAKFDLTLGLTETPEGLAGAFEYNTDLFDAITVERFAGYFRTLLEAVTADPARRLSELPLLTPGDRERLLA